MIKNEKIKLVLLLLATISLTAINSSAEEFPPEDDYEDLTVIDAAVSAFSTQSFEKCDCNAGESAYTRCLNKLANKAIAAFKPAAKFNREKFSELKSAINDEAALFVEECSDPEDELPDDDFPEDE